MSRMIRSFSFYSSCCRLMGFRTAMRKHHLKRAVFGLIAGGVPWSLFYLCAASDNGQLLTTGQRNGIVSQLKNYDIPIQILQMVVQESKCRIEIPAQTGKAVKRNNLERILPMM